MIDFSKTLVLVLLALIIFVIITFTVNKSQHIKQTEHNKQTEQVRNITTNAKKCLLNKDAPRSQRIYSTSLILINNVYM